MFCKSFLGLKVIVNVEPIFILLLTLIVACIQSDKFFTKDKPIPIPSMQLSLA